MPEATRQRLLERADIDNDDIDDIIEIAAQLHQAELDAAEGASIEEVQAVAEELDIPAAYVEQAIAVLHTQREEHQDRERKATLRATERRRVIIIAGLSGLGVAAALAVAAGTAVADAADSLAVAASNVEQHAAYVELVLDRQAGLVPQLLALSGGEPGELMPLATALSAAGPLEARLEASKALDLALGASLAALPAPQDDTEAIQRLGLTHELTGVQNRRATELRRLEDAQAEWTRASRLWGAGVALALGMAAEPTL
jgi:hypothetical protein